MELLYIVLFSVLCYMEISTRIDTSNIIRKTGIALMAIGALISLSKPNGLLAVGALIYFGNGVIMNFIRHRRYDDAKDFRLFR